MDRLKLPLTWIMALFCLALSYHATAEPAADKPFAEKKVVLQLSDRDAYKQTLVLNVASNLIKYYGPDRVDVEIVAFGPGLRLLMADNSNAGRIENLSENSGVRFSACSNTLKKYTQKLGSTPALHPDSKTVDAGVVRILELVEQGYTLIKP